MQALEQVVRVPLFDRRPTGVVLTPAGVALLAATRDVFARLSQVLRHVRQAHEGKMGPLRIGLSRLAVDSSRVGRAIVAVRAMYPDIDMSIAETSVYGHAGGLRAGTLDLAIALGADNDPAVKSHPLFVDVIDGAMFAGSHPLAERAVLEPQDLRGERLLVVSQAVQLFPKLFAHVERLGLRWEEIDSSDTVYAMVAAGIGWTLSVGGKRAGGFAQMAPPQGMVVRPVRGLNGTMPMTLKWRATETSRAVDNVARSLIAVFSGSREGKRSTPPRGARHITSPAAGAAGVPRGLELRQMQAFITTLEEKSLSRAALRVGLTQSGVSRQVRALERELECPLLQRGAHGVVPTVAGEVFGVEAAAVLGMVDAAITKARRAARGQEDFCVIGTIQPELTSGLVVRCLKQVAELYPRLEVEVREMSTAAQLDALRRGIIDVAIGGGHAAPTDDPLIASVALVDDPLEIALVSAAGPLASRAWIKATELRDVPFAFIARRFAPRMYDQVIQTLVDLGLVPSVTLTGVGPRPLWRIAADSGGWTLGTRSLRTAAPPGLVGVPIEGLSIPWGVRLMWRRETSAHAVQQVLELFRRNRLADTA